MPNEKSRSPDAGQGANRRRRAAPTIELKATEVSSEPVGPNEPAEVADPAAPAEQSAPTAPAVATVPAPETPAEAGFSVYPTPLEETSDHNPPETPASAAPENEAVSARQDVAGSPPIVEPPADTGFESPPEPPAAEPSHTASEPAEDRPPTTGPTSRLPGALAGAIGGAAALLVVLALWLLGAISGPAEPNDALTPRLAALETQMRNLAARPVAPAVDPRIGDISARLDKAETALAAPRPQTPDPTASARLNGIETALKTLTDNVTALRGRLDGAEAATRDARSRAEAAVVALTELQNSSRAATADHAQMEALASRTAALERTDRAVADELGKRAAAADGDRAMRLAVAASMLRTAVERGEPFPNEFATVKSLSNDAGALAALEPFAASGLPGAAALARDLLALMPAMQRAAGSTPREGGFLDRLQANAERLVRVRPIDEPAGEDVSAILTRIEVKAGHSDVSGALTELAKLPPAVRAPAEPWITRAQAQAKAVETNRRFAADAMAGLKTAP